MPEAKISGYGKILADWHGNAIGRGGINKCRKVKPFERGAWISNKVCSYYFKVDGAWYSCRGRGDGGERELSAHEERPAGAAAPVVDRCAAS